MQPKLKQFIVLGLGLALFGVFVATRVSPKPADSPQTIHGEFEPIAMAMERVESVQPEPAQFGIQTPASKLEPIPTSPARRVAPESAIELEWNTTPVAVNDSKTPAEGQVTSASPQADLYTSGVQTASASGDQVQSLLDSSAVQPDVVHAFEPSESESLAVELPAVDSPSLELPTAGPADPQTDELQSVFNPRPQPMVEQQQESDWKSNPHLRASASRGLSEGATIDAATGYEATQQANLSLAPLQVPLAEAAALKSAHHIEYGKSLARRGAAFAARQEFLAALKVIAESNDNVAGGNQFSRSLRDGIMILQESKDFVINDSEVVVDVAKIVDAHQSNVVSIREATNMTPNQALEKYLQAAQVQFDLAGGRNVVTAEALYCLGKLHRLQSERTNTPSNLQVAKAIVFHRAAIMSNPDHADCANELGVLMARTGQLQIAKDLLKKSLITKQTPDAWHNLAKVHDRMGEEDFAKMARNESDITANTLVADASSTIQWLPNKEFNDSAPMEFDTRIASSNGAPVPRAIPEPTQPTTDETEKDSEVRQAKNENWFKKKLKDLF